MNQFQRCPCSGSADASWLAIRLTGLALVLASASGCDPASTATQPAPSEVASVASDATPAAAADAVVASDVSEPAAPEPAVPSQAAEPDVAAEDRDVPLAEKPAETPANEANEGSETAEQAAEGQPTRGNPTGDALAAAESSEKPARVFSSSRAPARPGEAEKISFDDLVIGLQADVVFRPWMMGDRPKELDGKKIRISGFMHAGAEPVKTKEFVLLRNLECKFGPGGQADHLAQVYMKPGTTTRYPGKDPIKVEGTLKVQPFEGTDGNTWSLYRIEDAEVVR